VGLVISVLSASTATAGDWSNPEHACKHYRKEVHAYLTGKKLDLQNGDAILATSRTRTLKLNGKPLRAKIASLDEFSGAASNFQGTMSYPTAWVTIPYSSAGLPDIEWSWTDHKNHPYNDTTPDLLYCEYALSKTAKGWSRFKTTDLLQTWSGGALDNHSRLIPGNTRKSFVAIVVATWSEPIWFSDHGPKLDEELYLSVEIYGKGRDLTRKKATKPADSGTSSGAGAKEQKKTSERPVPVTKLSPKMGTANKPAGLFKTLKIKFSKSAAAKRPKRMKKKRLRRRGKKNARKGKKKKSLSDVVDKYEEVEEAVKDFGNSTCGKATGRCWKQVKKAVKKKNKACRAFRKCRQRCRSKKRGSKQACFNARDCGKLRGKAKKLCKKGCRKGARLVKRSCFTKTCGRRPTACRQGWSGIGSAIGQCARSIKDTDCGSWAKRLVKTTKKKDADIEKEADEATE
jgi:hypothetical protein